MFQKKNPKLSKQTECDKDYGTDVLKGPGPLSPETLPSHFEGLIFLTQRQQHGVHDFVAYIYRFTWLSNIFPCFSNGPQ